MGRAGELLVPELGEALDHLHPPTCQAARRDALQSGLSQSRGKMQQLGGWQRGDQLYKG